ncbi:hypothetical protein [Catellatospora methionotrophica]|uniref:hypothetical protein n=1 Tax=Catellatospora methionotrophica TaxID=121620 RepID=UPI0033E79BF8
MKMHRTPPSATAADPLLVPLTAPQLRLLNIVGDAVLENLDWPIYQYVEGRMDHYGLDIDEVFGSLPYLSAQHLHYSLLTRDRNGTTEDSRVKLTVAGMGHLPSFTTTSGMFLRVLRELRKRRATATYNPTKVIEVVISGSELIDTLNLGAEPLVGMLPEILSGEPATWHGTPTRIGDDWTLTCSRWLRHFGHVRDIHDYVERLRAWIMPDQPVAAPTVASPLELVGALDYLDVVWQLEFKGRPLVVLPSAERTARLAFDANSAEEFDSRLSALGEVLKGLRIPGRDKAVGTMAALEQYLSARLGPEPMTRVKPALDKLQLVTQIRNAGQHVDASTKAARALPSFGLTYPISDHRLAWGAVQAHVVEALNVIRDEIRMSGAATNKNAASQP